MSAWMLGKEHIDVLVTAARGFGLIEEGEEAQLGRELWAENVRSYNYRYDGRYADECPDPDTYVWEPRPVEVMAYVATAASCYGYQACEHPEWEASLACQVTKRIKDMAEARGGITGNDSHREFGGWPVQVNDEGVLLLRQSEVIAYWDYCREQRAKGLEWSETAGAWVPATEEETR